jgi:hypothetical protein
VDAPAPPVHSAQSSTSQDRSGRRAEHGVRASVVCWKSESAPDTLVWVRLTPLLLNIQDGACSFIQGLNDRMSAARDALQLPNFSGEPVIQIFSDYSGDSENSSPASTAHGKYRTYSFLFAAGEDGMASYRNEVLKIRQRHKVPADKEIAFKHIHKDDSIHSALPELVGAARGLNGFIFTLAVERSVRSLFGGQDANIKTARAGGLGSIKPGPLERALRVSYSIAFWLSVLAEEDQQAIWITDRDEILASPRIISETYQILSASLVEAGYRGARIGGSNHRLINIVDYDGFPGRDLLSIPDLVAGAVARCLSDLQESDFREQRGVDTILDIVTPQLGGSLNSVILTIEPPHYEGKIRWFERRSLG